LPANFSVTTQVKGAGVSRSVAKSVFQAGSKAFNPWSLKEWIKIHYLFKGLFAILKGAFFAMF